MDPSPVISIAAYCLSDGEFPLFCSGQKILPAHRGTARDREVDSAMKFPAAYFFMAASTSSSLRGIAPVRFSQPVSVTWQLSSRRKPMPLSSS